MRPVSPLEDGAPIRGRSDETRLIDGLVADLGRGRGAVLIVEGPPGIGKSRLLAELGIRAETIGARLLVGQASEDQRTVPFGPLLSATADTSPPIADPEAFKNLGAAGDLGFWTIQQLQTALASAAAMRPLMIAIDDLHWADAGTLMALRGLVSGLSNLPVLWALATRPAESTPLVHDALDTIAGYESPRTHRVRLNALTDDAVAAIAADVLCADVDETVLNLTHRTHGNPFLVLELLRGLTEEDRIRVEASRASAIGGGLPHRLTDNMNQRLDRLSHDARRTIQVASVLPPLFSAALLAGMMGLAATQLLASIDEAIRADLLTDERDHFRFRHDLLRQAARQSIPHALRRALERESARLLLAQGAGPVEVAAQLARSADVGDSAAVAALREASSAMVQSDPSGAAELSQRAVELLRPDDPLRPAVIAETAERLRRASRWDDVQQLAATTITPDMPGEEEALVRMSLSTMNDTHAAAKVAQNRRALELDGVTEATRARHLGYLASNLTLEGRNQLAHEAARAAMDAADAIDDPSTRLLAETTLALVEAPMGSGRNCLERVHRLLAAAPTADEHPAALAFVHGANLLLTLGQVDEANALCDMLLAASRATHYEEAVHVFSHVRAHGDFAAGRLAAARQLLDSIPEDQRYGAKNVNTLIGSPVVAALAVQAEDLPLQRRVASAVRPLLSEGITERRAAVGSLAYMAWQRGDLDEAARWLSADLDLLGTPAQAIHLDQLVIAARLVASSGDAGLRERVLTAATRLEHDGEPMPVFAGVAAHVRGLVDQDLEVLEAAASVLVNGPRPLLWAGAVEDIGHALARNGFDDDAAARLSAAFDALLQCGATADCRRVSRSLQELGVTRRVVRPRTDSGWESLTAAEQRVFHLVAAGATNREVAQKLSISSHTVNAHLRKVFAKLGVHSRAELARVAAPTPS